MGDDDERARLLARAYGPGADIAADPAAVARLRELEDAARPASARPASAPSSPPPPIPSAGAASPGGPARRPGDPPVRRPDAEGASGRATPAAARPPRALRVAIAVVGLAGLVLGGAAAVRTAVALAPVEVMQLSAEPGAPGFLVDASDQAPPNFPIAEDMQWSAPLGTVLGWDVWVGRSRSNFACLAVVRSATVRADCVSAQDFDSSGVTVYLPPGDVSADLRPAELTGTAALAYRWWPDRSVSVRVER